MPQATIDHLAIAVPSIREALRLFMDVFGAEFMGGADDERLGIRTIQLRLPPGVKIELMEPLNEDSYLQRYLEKHGPGFHHMTTFFPDIEQVIPELEERGFEVVDTDLSDSSWRETFVRPRSGFGTLLQIADTTADWHTSRPGMTPEATTSRVGDSIPAGAACGHTRGCRLRAGPLEGFASRAYGPPQYPQSMVVTWPSAKVMVVSPSPFVGVHGPGVQRTTMETTSSGPSSSWLTASSAMDSHHAATSAASRTRRKRTRRSAPPATASARRRRCSASSPATSTRCTT